MQTLGMDSQAAVQATDGGQSANSEGLERKGEASCQWKSPRRATTSIIVVVNLIVFAWIKSIRKAPSAPPSGIAPSTMFGLHAIANPLTLSPQMGTPGSVEDGPTFPFGHLDGNDFTFDRPEGHFLHDGGTLPHNTTGFLTECGPVSTHSPTMRSH